MTNRHAALGEIRRLLVPGQPQQLNFANLQDQDNLSNLGQTMVGFLISRVQGWGWCANCHNEFEI